MVEVSLIVEYCLHMMPYQSECSCLLCDPRHQCLLLYRQVIIFKELNTRSNAGHTSRCPKKWNEGKNLLITS